MKKFLKLVEIQTKIASVIPFFIGTVLALFLYDSFQLSNFVYMLVSLLSIDMMATALNNYMDFRRAIHKEGYGYEEHNALGKYGLNQVSVLILIVGLFLNATLFGILLVLNTNYIVLLLGILSFLVGILYSAGPIPISRTPLGEIFSGFFMGFIIIFLSVYIHIIDMDLLLITYKSEVLTVSFKIIQLIIIFILSVVPMAAIANIMLVNNICDMDEDFVNKRYTLPILIGKRNALVIFTLLSFVSYATVTLMVIVGTLPIYTLLYLLTLIPVLQNMRAFYRKQDKRTTFIIAIKNFMVQNVSYLFLLIFAVLLNNLF